MDNNASPQVESGETSLEVKPDSQASKKRKMIQKRVVSVRIGENVSKVKNEGLPSDLWSWRKYGQKPIKGSPYPRGYYRCSTSKGCSAKKQVERSSTDSSMLVITYTSTHNHPDPTAVSATNSARKPKDSESETETIQDIPITSKEEDQEHVEQETNNTKSSVTNEENFHYLQSSIEDPFKLNMEKHQIDLVLEEKPVFYAAELENSSESKSEELDYFDELEELPMSSSVFQFTRSIFSDERIPVAPS